MSDTFRKMRINSAAILDQYVRENQLNQTEAFTTNMHKQLLIDLEK